MARTWHGLLALLLCAFAMSACADENRRKIEITAKSIPFAIETDAPASLGKLRHLGTLRLKSPDRDFGGISGLIVSPDGRKFLALSDTSHWLTGELQYRGNQLAGVTGTDIAPMLDLKGKPMSGKQGDAEGLTGSLDGDVYVSFEGKHRIWRYPFGTSGLDANPTVVANPKDLENAPGNGGLEAITLLHDGNLLAITEEFFDSNGNINAWNLDVRGKMATPLVFKRRKPFDVTDVRQLPSGDILTLERRFSPVGGVGFEMRRFSGSAIKAQTVIEGEVIAEAAMNYNIDNMEGLAVRTGENGETLVYIISDDNFNAPLQQTLLMLFELKP